MRTVKIQINEFILGQGRVPRFENVSEEEANRLCQYKNVYRVITNITKK